MRIAAAVIKNSIAPSFKNAERFDVYEADGDARIFLFNFEANDADDAAEKMNKLGVRAVVCGAIDGVSRVPLMLYGIAILAGKTGVAEEALKDLSHSHDHGGDCDGQCGTCAEDACEECGRHLS